jgi:HPt (histidine-containing phosphotransfer) domain-containing protein
MSDLQNSQEIPPTLLLSVQSVVTGPDNPVNDSAIVIEKLGNENLFDLTLIEEMDDHEYTSDVLTIFLGNTPKELNDLKVACTSDKFEDAYKMAHKLKGGAGLVQAKLLLTVLSKIEETAKNKIANELANLAALANDEYKKIDAPLKEHLRNIENVLRTSR